MRATTATSVLSSASSRTNERRRTRKTEPTPRPATGDGRHAKTCDTPLAKAGTVAAHPVAGRHVAVLGGEHHDTVLLENWHPGPCYRIVKPKIRCYGTTNSNLPLYDWTSAKDHEHDDGYERYRALSPKQRRNVSGFSSGDTQHGALKPCGKKQSNPTDAKTNVTGDTRQH